MSENERDIRREKPIDPRDILFLADQSNNAVTVLPSSQWAFHYPDIEKRQSIIQGLLDGTQDLAIVGDELRPSHVLFDTKDVVAHGKDAVLARLVDTTALLEHYDYDNLAQFLSSLKGKDIDAATAEGLYDALMQARVRHQLLDSYGSTGRQQIRDAVIQDARRTAEQFSNAKGLPKVLEALKLESLSRQIVQDKNTIDELLNELTSSEKAQFDRLRDYFSQFAQNGDPRAYQQIISTIHSEIPSAISQQDLERLQQELEQLQEDLEPFMDQISPPGTPNDPGIPPEDSDEYHTQEPSPGESKEQSSQKPFFEVVPKGNNLPLTGYYASGRKSYYDVNTKTWSKKKVLKAYESHLQGDKRQTLFATVREGLTAIPIPVGYALDKASLKATGAEVNLFRDQNGCFYIQSDGLASVSVDFLKESLPFISLPIAEDRQQLYSGSLSHETEDIINRLQGSAEEMAAQARRYIQSHHEYPGNGDLEMASALQHKLRTESTGDTYLQMVDQSKYLECYSANTLFVAMMRKKGIAARLVIGHRIQSAKQGKVAMDGTTGHAWSEIWNGSRWMRVDATPAGQNQDQNQNNQNEDPSQEADDENNNDNDTQNNQQQQQGKSSGTQMGQASQGDVQRAESQMQQMQQQVEKQKEQKKSMDQKIQEADTFKDLRDMQEQTERAEMFDDQKKDLEKRIEAKKEEMKNDIKDKLDQMVDEGFMDESMREKLEKQLESDDLKDLRSVEHQLNFESAEYNAYQEIKDQVEDYVEEWYRYFMERLPSQPEADIDEDSLTRSGAFNKRAVNKARNLLFGTIKNPRVMKPDSRPLFLASMVIDVSLSMQDNNKIQNARKLAVFANELFTRINAERNYVRFSVDAFASSVIPIKSFSQDYESNERYQYDSTESPQTVKARLMRGLQVRPETNMLDAVQKVAQGLNAEKADYPNYASAMYFIGDGEDTRGNSDKVREFMKTRDEEIGFGDHMHSAIMLGSERERQVLSSIFGEDHTAVADNFNDLISAWMEQFDMDIQDYLRDKMV